MISIKFKDQELKITISSSNNQKEEVLRREIEFVKSLTNNPKIQLDQEYTVVKNADSDLFSFSLYYELVKFEFAEKLKKACSTAFLPQEDDNEFTPALRFKLIAEGDVSVNLNTLVMDFDEENNEWEAGRNLFRVALCAVEEVKKKFLAAKEKNKEAAEIDRTECARAVETAVAFVKQLGVKGIKLIAIAAIRGNAIAQMDLMDIFEFEENPVIFLMLLKSLLTQKNMPNEVAYDLKLRTENLIEKLIQPFLRDLQPIPKDAPVNKIIEVISVCAEQGYEVAQYILSDLYKEGIGVKEDINKALALLELAAKQGGQVYAQIALGRLLLKKFEENQVIFLALLKSLLSQKNMPNEVAYDLKLSIETLIKQLIQNLLRDLQSVPKNAPVHKIIIEVISVYAEQGHGVAQYILSDMYKEGIGVEKNVYRAMELLELAAKHKGQVYAQIALGRLYHWMGIQCYYDPKSKLTFFSESTHVYEQVVAQGKFGSGDAYSLSRMYGYLNNKRSQYFSDIFETLRYKMGIDLHLKSCQEARQRAAALVNDRDHLPDNISSIPAPQ